jgi:hypothetical protein
MRDRTIARGHRVARRGAAPNPGRPSRLAMSLVTVGLACAIMVGVAAPSPALTFPTSQDLLDRILTAVRMAEVTSVDMLIKFRVGNAITAPPTCVFQGVLHVAPDQTALALSHSTPSPVCWMLDRYVLGRLFSDRDHANTLLPSFHFDVLGMKVVDGRSYYLLYGRALAPGADPQSMIGWVDYDRGLITDGTIQYAWGQVNLTQDYGLVDGIWVLVHQYIVVPRFSASLEISYSGFQFLSHQ